MLHLWLPLLVVAQPTVLHRDLDHLAASESPRAFVERLARESPALLGLSLGDGLTDLQELELPSGAIVRARRTHQGLPVLGSAIAVRFAADGQPRAVRADLVDLPDFAPPRLDAAQAAATAILARTGLRLSPADAARLALPARLAIDAETAALVWIVHVPGVLPHQRRTVLVDAHSGQVVAIRSPIRRGAADANVFIPHPTPGAVLDAPTVVELERLTPADPAVLEGEYVEALSCMTDDENVRVRTCLDVFGGYACLSADYRDLIISFCGEGHLAIGQGETDGFKFAPEDDLLDYGVDQWPLNDPFAEVHVYYHLDQVTDWLDALGHPVGFHTPQMIMANLSMPSMELLACEQTAWAAEPDGSRTVERAREIVADCHAAGHGYMPFDNAFFLGDDLEDLLGVRSGIYMGQGSVVDFAYDGAIIYHEYGHAVATQLGALGGGTVQDARGLDVAPGSLGEAFSDYFAAALTDDPVTGGYVGARYGSSEGIRTLEHDLVCPYYLNGEVHEDSKAFAAAMWDVRQLYPAEETDPGTGRTVRVFDRVVYQALAALPAKATFALASEALLAEIQAEPLLEDPTAYHATCALNARNVVTCDRVVPLCNTAIPELYFASRGSNDPLFGGVVYNPGAPGPFQLVVDVPGGVTTAAFTASLGDGQPSMEDPPDFIGGTPTPTAWNLQLVYKVGAPISFAYAGTSTVTVTHDGDGVVPLTVSGTGPFTASATLDFPSGATRVYYALLNATTSAGRMADLRISTNGFACPAPPAAPSSIDCLSDPPPPPSPKPTDPDGGCDCAQAPGVVWLALALVGLRRRRRA